MNGYFNDSGYPGDMTQRDLDDEVVYCFWCHRPLGDDGLCGCDSE